MHVPNAEKFLRSGVANCRFASGDVYLRTLAQQAFGYHAANATGAAGDECDAAFEGNEFGGVHVIS